MPITLEQQLAEGARNLLGNCARLEPGDSLLIVRENPENTPNRDLESAIEAHGCTIFFARIGDRERFTELAAGSKQVMCYARDADMLASLYGRTSHRLLAI